MTVKLFAVGLMISPLLVATATAQSAMRGFPRQNGGVANLFAPASRAASDMREPTGREAANSPDYASRAPEEKKTVFDLSRVDEGVTREFKKAWRCSGGGVKLVEGLVLIFRRMDGSYLAVSQGCPNQFMAFTFRWRASIIALVHTHPNAKDSKPSRQDEQIAERFKVPIFTITGKGMFVYDPTARKTGKVMEGLDWLKADKFRQPEDGPEDYAAGVSLWSIGQKSGRLTGRKK